MPQQVGFLYSGSPSSLGPLLRKFRNAMPGGVTVVPRPAGDDYGSLPGHANHLINVDRVDVLVAAGGPVSALAAQQATAAQPPPKTPVVFTSATDPVGSGLYVANGNLTGIVGMTTEMDAARLRLLQELIPGITNIGVLRNPNRPNVTAQWNNLVQGRDPNLNLVPQDAGVQGTPVTRQQITQAIQNLPANVEALLVTADPMFNSRRPDVIPAVTAKRVPAIYQWREFAEEGGLMSFGPSLDEEYSAAANYVVLILNGENVANIPLYQPTKLELVINVGVAKMLGRTVPPALLARADEVIE